MSDGNMPERRQPDSTVSRQHLCELVFSKPATIEHARRDQYGRLVGKVFVKDWDTNLTQVEAGLAGTTGIICRNSLQPIACPSARCLHSERLAAQGLQVDVSHTAGPRLAACAPVPCP